MIISGENKLKWGIERETSLPVENSRERNKELMKEKEGLQKTIYKKLII